ncbi:MAG: hypothetical protein IT300_14955 [Dehalococcoidia bacterium]|nr:hypothetical protein [Dehalococcoidia bacterium]
MADEQPGRRNESPLRASLATSEVRVAIITALTLLLQAVLAKNVLDVELDYWGQFAPLWVFIAFMLSNQRDRHAELGTIAVIVVTSAAVLMLYAVW